MLVAMPTAIPVVPLTNKIGQAAPGRYTGWVALAVEGGTELDSVLVDLAASSAWRRAVIRHSV